MSVSELQNLDVLLEENMTKRKALVLEYEEVKSKITRVNAALSRLSGSQLGQREERGIVERIDKLSRQRVDLVVEYEDLSCQLAKLAKERQQLQGTFEEVHFKYMVQIKNLVREEKRVQEVLGALNMKSATRAKFALGRADKAHQAWEAYRDDPSPKNFKAVSTYMDQYQNARKQG